MTYEIQDKDGYLFSFDDVLQADKAFDSIIMTLEPFMAAYNLSELEARSFQRKFDVAWNAPLKLVQVHRIYK